MPWGPRRFAPGRPGDNGQRGGGGRTGGAPGAASGEGAGRPLRGERSAGAARPGTRWPRCSAATGWRARRTCLGGELGASQRGRHTGQRHGAADRRGSREDRTGPGPVLVLAGYPGWQNSDLLPAAGLARLGARFRQIGRVSDAELWPLPRGRRCSPSPACTRVSALPVLEAMAAGAPVVASDIPAIREVAGAAALLVPPGDAGAWTGAIEALLAVALGERPRWSTRGGAGPNCSRGRPRRPRRWRSTGSWCPDAQRPLSGLVLLPRATALLR